MKAGTDQPKLRYGDKVTITGFGFGETEIYIAAKDPETLRSVIERIGWECDGRKFATVTIQKEG